MLRQLIYPACAVLLLAVCLEARSVESDADGVIPSPNQDFGDETSASKQQQVNDQPLSKLMANVPVYISPYARAERSAPVYENQQESVEEPRSSYARASSPLTSAASTPAVPSASRQKDLKAAASYGHGHHGGHHGGHHKSHHDDHHDGHHYDHSGWLDMGAWTGGKGSFGWYADYPVSSKHGYGKRR